MFGLDTVHEFNVRPTTPANQLATAWLDWAEANAANYNVYSLVPRVFKLPTSIPQATMPVL